MVGCSAARCHFVHQDVLPRIRPNLFGQIGSVTRDSSDVEVVLLHWWSWPAPCTSLSPLDLKTEPRRPKQNLQVRDCCHTFRSENVQLEAFISFAMLATPQQDLIFDASSKCFELVGVARTAAGTQVKVTICGTTGLRHVAEDLLPHVAAGNFLRALCLPEIWAMALLMPLRKTKSQELGGLLCLHVCLALGFTRD